MDKQLEQVLTLRENGQLKEANQLMVALVEEEPENAYYQFQCAWTYDSLGQEKEAVPHYEKAIQLGLEPAILVDAYLGLGARIGHWGCTNKRNGHWNKLCTNFLKPSM